MNTHTLGLIIGLGFGAAISIPIYAEPDLLPEPIVALCTPVTEPIVRAEAAYVFDVESGRALYQKNAEAQLPLASLSKIMTVYAALDALTTEASVTVPPEALTPEGDWGFKNNEVWRAGDLAAYTLIESANDGARALMLAAAEKLGMSEADFIDAMNRRARGLDLVQTYFINETGLDVSASVAGAYGSARDMATLLTHIALTAPERIESSVRREATFVSASGVTHRAKNTALLASAYGSAIGSKTGFTDLAGGNLAFIYEPLPGRPVAIVVLGSTREGREADVDTLATYARTALTRAVTCHD